VKHNKSITVLIPAYNAAAFIVKALDSIRLQTLLPSKVIVINDGSTDNTGAVISKWQQQNELPFELQLITQKNGGMSAARNAGLAASNTELIALLDADDWYFPEFLSVAHNAFCKIPDLDLFFANQRVVNQNDEKLHEWLTEKAVVKVAQTKLEPDLITIDEEILPSMINGSYISCSASMLKLDKMRAIGCYDETIRAAEDLDFFLRYMQGAKVAFTYRELTNIYRNSGSITQSRSRYMHLHDAQIFKRYEADFEKNGMDITSAVNNKLRACFYDASINGFKELCYFHQQVAILNPCIRPKAKDWLRSIFYSIKHGLN
jgi:glycosyltransferase involved in cell wall biosynthesis